jgi:hypothetical protein
MAYRYLVPPIVNMNGTSRQELLDQQLDVLVAIEALIATMRKAAPNARDFQPKPQDYIPAREAWNERVEALIEMKGQLASNAYCISQQGDGRATSKG